MLLREPSAALPTTGDAIARLGRQDRRGRAPAQGPTCSGYQRGGSSGAQTPSTFTSTGEAQVKKV